MILMMEAKILNSELKFRNLEKEKKCVDLEFGKSQWVDFKWRVDVVVHYSLRLLEDFSRSFCYGNFFFNVPLIQRGYESKCSRYENLLEKFVQL